MATEKNKIKTREEILFPYLSTPLDERLEKSDSIDLKDNFIIEKKNGYWSIKPINNNKKILDIDNNLK